MTGFTNAWRMNHATGSLRRLHPTVLVLCFVVLLVLLQILDPGTPRHLLLMFVAVAAWVGSAGLTVKSLVSWLAVGVALFAPFFLLAPWIEGGAPVITLPVLGVVGERGLLVSARLAGRGMACLLLGAGLLAASTPTRIAVGLGALPVPRMMVVMGFLVLQWTEVLLQETQNILRAMRLRGAHDGWRGSWVLVRSLPLVWIPRVAARAERVAMAMELRGYQGELPEEPLAPVGVMDAVAMAACVALLVGVMA